MSNENFSRDKFENSLLKHRINTSINDFVQKAWSSEANKRHTCSIANSQRDSNIDPDKNKNISTKNERIEHKTTLAYLFKRIFNFLNVNSLNEKSDEHGQSLAFDVKVFSQQHVVPNKSYINFKTISSNSYIESLLHSSDLKDLIGKFVFSATFQVLLSVAIVLNSVMLAVQTDDTLTKTYAFTLRLLESFSNTVFLLEFVLKNAYECKLYWLNIWNVFDFVLLLCGLMSIMITQESNVSAGDASKFFRIFRVFRALRSLRSINIFSRLQIIVNTFFKSIFDMVNMVILMLLTMIMFSLFGCSLFSDTAETQPHFGNLDKGMLTLFYCATREGLTDLFNALDNTDEFWFIVFWKTFLVVIIILFAFIFTNLIVAIVVTNMENSLKDFEKSAESDLQMRLIEGSDQLPIDENSVELLNSVYVKDIVRGNWIILNSPLKIKKNC